MKTQRPKSILLIAVTLVCALWAATASAIPMPASFSFRGTADVASLYAVDAQGNSVQPDFAAYDTKFLINLKTSSSTTYSFNSTFNYYELSGLTGSVTLSGGFDSTSGAPANLKFTGSFDEPLYVAYSPDLLALGFGPVGGGDLMGIYDFGLTGAYDLTTGFGPFTVPTNNFTAPDFAAFLTDSNGFPLEFELLINDVTSASAAAVPEPSTFVLIGLGLAGLGIARRRMSTK